MKRVRGFTLIELLVVVAIIALLIALLMPTLAKAREEAKLVKCQANMHELGVSLTTYCHNNGGLLPNRHTFRLLASQLPSSMAGSGSVIGDPNKQYNLHYPEALFIDGDVAQSPATTGHNPSCGRGIFQCPNHATERQNNADDQYGTSRGYGMAFNGCTSDWSTHNVDGSFLASSSGNPNMFRRSNSIWKLLPNKIWAAEGWVELGRTSSGAPPNVSEYGVYFKRHKRNQSFGANYLMAGGQVEWNHVYHTYTSSMPGSVIPKPPKDMWFHDLENAGK